MAAVHLCATLPNFLILEHREDDVPQRYEVMHPQPEIKNGYLTVPTTPGLGIDIDEDAIGHYPSSGNISDPNMDEYTYVWARTQRATGANRKTPVNNRE